MFEILLRFPGKELCRLRAGCRAWHSLLSDPLFAAAHTARHAEPLIVVGYADDTSNGIFFDIIDLLSGRIVKRVVVQDAANTTRFERVVSTQLDLICVAEVPSGRFRVLNPGTGLVWTLPQGLAAEHGAHEPYVSRDRTSVAIGQVASTGEYKLLRTLHCSPAPNTNLQLYEVITLPDAGSNSHTRWRGKSAPPYTFGLGAWSSVVADGFVYFFSDEVGQEQEQHGRPLRIGSFDLETEQWRPEIRGPRRSVLNDHPSLRDNQSVWGKFSLAVLNGCLVVVHRTVPCLDLWFLEDPGKGVWVMRQRILLEMKYMYASFSYKYAAERTIRPVLVLNDGRVVLVQKGREASLKIYDPNSHAFAGVAEIRPCTAIGLYTGNLLSLANGGPFMM